MSGVVIFKKESLILYIDDYDIGSKGYLISYIKGDSSKKISSQCRVKVVDSMVFGTMENSKKYFMNLMHEYPSESYQLFVTHCIDRIVVVCVKIISDWEIDLLREKDITHLILYCDTNFDNDYKKDMIIFNR